MSAAPCDGPVTPSLERLPIAGRGLSFRSSGRAKLPRPPPPRSELDRDSTGLSKGGQWGEANVGE